MQEADKVNSAINTAGKRASLWAQCLMAERLIGPRQMDLLRMNTIYDQSLRESLNTRLGLTEGIDVITASSALLQILINQRLVSMVDLTRSAGVVLKDLDFMKDILDISEECGIAVKDADQVIRFVKWSVQHMISVSAVVASQRDHASPRDIINTGFASFGWMPPECLVTIRRTC